MLLLISHSFASYKTTNNNYLFYPLVFIKSKTHSLTDRAKSHNAGRLAVKIGEQIPHKPTRSLKSDLKIFSWVHDPDP